MSFRYVLKFQSEQDAKDVLKPLGYAVDSKYGVVFLNITSRYILSNKDSSEGYFVIIESSQEESSLASLTGYMVNE